MADYDEPIWLRPERAATGRPAVRSRPEITAAALAVADRGGLDAVSMRNVAAELGTGGASLYRYVGGRDDLLDLMVDAAAADVRLGDATGDPVADLVAVGEALHAVMARHRWLPELVLTRPSMGPNAVRVLDHVLEVLADHPADGRAKLEVFALLNAVVATFALNEHAGAARPGQAAAYLGHVAATGERPRITALLGDLAAADGTAAPDRRADALGRIVSGLLA
ncbi:TetR/AcrR family transcriptional regulator [Glycomyces terrestris]|uniref:TetR/AcrR family transcriptional regulator n=1 Tax=Glycomyces terrestris TaxID=2493553 RepID=A0A426UW47_9ACTN|nr:TetR/AcrR family transcriptional regulator [Glycomyces terrestris]RRR98544.1 TetR/AcrR family transcriptional regulator [Glycomyces terrestris]